MAFFNSIIGILAPASNRRHSNVMTGHQMIDTNKNRLLRCAAAVLFMLHGSGVYAESACHFIEQASLDIIHGKDQSTPLIAGKVNGKPVNLILDTGASQTYLLRGEVDRQHLNPERTSIQTQGIGGLSSIFLVKVKEFAIGDAHVTNVRFPVLDALNDADAAGLIGVDFLMQYDVELHLAANRVKLFRADHCQERALAYWDQNASSVPMDFMDGSNTPGCR